MTQPPSYGPTPQETAQTHAVPHYPPQQYAAQQHPAPHYAAQHYAEPHQAAPDQQAPPHQAGPHHIPQHYAAPDPAAPQYPPAFAGPAYPPPFGPVPAPPRRGTPRWVWFAVAAGVLAIVLAGTGVGYLVLSSGGGASTLGSTPLEKARDTCAQHSGGVAVEDGGRTLTIDTKGEEESAGATYTEYSCIIDALDVPGSVRAKIGNTRALDGMVTADWDGYSASWNYHPDKGINMVISMS